MKVAVPQEIVPGERRVALIPESVAKLRALGLAVTVEAGAGEAAGYSDQAYETAGASVVPDVAALWREADLVLKVQKPVRNEALRRHELDLLRPGAALIAFLQPLISPDLVQLMLARRLTSFSMDAIPRLTRAQPMDALSSMSTVAGYKAVLLAANALGKLFPLLMTAAGTLAPARVFVLGAGVAGLQAIATARRLGAVVEAFDTRPVVKEQVESLGATFVELAGPQEQAEGSGGYAKQMSEDFYRRERDLLHQHVSQADVVITTALVPGQRAPLLVTEDMVKAMRLGSVVVDLAAEMGGNCALTEPGKEIERHGVTILGPLNVPSTVPLHASQMYSRNITSLVAHLVRNGELYLDLADEITRGACITYAGQVVNAQVRSTVEKAAA